MSSSAAGTKAAGSFPADSPGLWFVSAVPFTLAMLRYYHERSSFDAAREVLARMISDLEAGETGALDMVRDLCLAAEAGERQ